MILYRFLRPLVIFLCRIIFLIQIKGRKNIPQEKGVIIASNHISFLDPLVLGVAFPGVLYFMAKGELFQNKIFSWLISTLGAFEVKKGKPDRKALKKAQNLLKQGEAVVIFPEGTRSRDGKIKKGEIGCVWLAKFSRVPIVPVRIYGTNFALPPDAKMIHPHSVRVVFGKPLNVGNYPNLDLEKLTEILMARIKEL